MKIDLTCPVELRRCQLPNAEYPVCEMLFFNLSDKPVSSMQISFLCCDENKEQIFRAVERLTAKDAPARNIFRLDYAFENAAGIYEMEVAVKKVWFEDGTVWRSEAGAVSEFAPTPRLEENQMQVMQELAGEDAITYPSDQGAVWVCICGRPNAASEDTCRRCGRDKHEIFVNFNQAEIEKIIFQRVSAAEEEERKLREAQRKKKEDDERIARQRRHRRRTIIACTVSALIILGLAFGYFYYLKPRNRYSTAVRWFDNGRYGDAKEVFGELNDADYFFGKFEKKFTTRVDGEDLDYAAMMTECDYRAACSALEEGTNLEEVARAFDALPGHPGSVEKAREARYLIAENKFNKNRWQEAIDAFNEVGDPDFAPPAGEGAPIRPAAGQMILHARYQQAMELEENRQYQDAYDMYTKEEYGLKGYQQADQRANDCLHAMAAQDMENGDYKAAIEKYEQLPGYDDSARQLQIAYYNYADQLIAGGNYTDAAVYFDKAGKYLDAERRAKYECRYIPAVNLLNEGREEKNEEKLQDAASRFKALTNYEDSPQMFCECLCVMAEIKLEEGKFEEALALLDETTDYRRADELRFEIAKAYLESGDEDAALAQFEKIPDFTLQAESDVPDETEEGTGEGGSESEGKADGGGEEQEEEGSRKYMQQICYGRAMGSMEQALALREANQNELAAEEYLNAAGLFEMLGDYEDSAEYVPACLYNRALILIDMGEYEEAVTLLSGMPDYEDAADMVLQAKYAQAEALENANDDEGAMIIWRELENYSDVREKRERCAVRLAKAEIEAGNREAAFAWLEGCTGAEALELRNSMGFSLAGELEAEGDLIGAAEKYDALGNYNGSREKAAACRRAYYSTAQETVDTAMKNKDYLTVIETLDALDMSALGKEYEGLQDSYNEACYRLANNLYSDGDIYTAYAYYMRVPDYSDVSEKKLNRACYLIFGKWEDSSGENKMEFRPDGTCFFLGKECYYKVQGQYSLKIGDNPDELNSNYELVSGPSLKNKNLTIRKLPEKKPYYYMTRSPEE